MTIKKLAVHLVNPETPAMAGRYIGSLDLPDDFPMPTEDQSVQWTAGPFVVSVREIEND